MDTSSQQRWSISWRRVMSDKVYLSIVPMRPSHWRFQLEKTTKRWYVAGNPPLALAVPFHLDWRITLKHRKGPVFEVDVKLRCKITKKWIELEYKFWKQICDTCKQPFHGYDWDPLCTGQNNNAEISKKRPTNCPTNWVLETRSVFLESIRKLKAPICEFEFALSTKLVIALIGTEESCPMIVEINLIHRQTRP